MKAVGYTRLSQDSDTSIPRQTTGIREYCEEQGFELVEILDDGRFSSGFDVQRSEYQKVKSMVNDRAVGAVVVYDKSRIGRDFDERMQLVLDLRQADVELHSARRGWVDLSDPTDAAVESIHAAKDDEVKREEIEKSKEAVAERLEAGHDHGRPRYGMTYNEDGTTQVPGENFNTVLKVLQMKSRGASYSEIEDDLDVSSSTAQRIISRREWYRDRAQMGEKPDV